MDFFLPDNSTFKGLSANLEFKENSLRLSYHFDANLPYLELPYQEEKMKPSSLSRKVELWKSTCFELFLKAPSSDEYFELNFSPIKKAYNIFHFSSYRSALQETTKIKLIEAYVRPGLVQMQLQLPHPHFQCHPKVILNPTHKKEDTDLIYLSDIVHPDTGPNFHIFP